MVDETKVRVGYKKTEIGVIPEDWDYLKVEECVSIKTGSKNTEDRIEDGKYPFFVRSQKVEKIDTFSFDCEAVLTAGDGVGTGKVFHHINQKFDAHQRVYVMSDFKNVTGSYFFNYFSGFFYDEVCKYTAKSSVDSVRRDMIAKMMIPVPPLNEQECIANVLTDTDNLIKSIEKLIDKKKKIKQGTMQQLLTEKKRLAGFSGEWDGMKLGELLDYEQPTKYIVQSEIVEKGSTPVLTANKSFLLGYTEDSGGIFTELPVIIFDDFTTLSKKVDFPFKVRSSALKILKAKNQYVDINFVYGLMQIIKFHIGDHKRYYLSEYQFIDINIPTLKEQKAIAQILSDMDLEIESLEQKLSKYKAIKQGMMQELLTGRIRLI